MSEELAKAKILEKLDSLDLVTLRDLGYALEDGLKPYGVEANFRGRSAEQILDKIRAELDKILDAGLDVEGMIKASTPQVTKTPIADYIAEAEQLDTMLEAGFVSGTLPSSPPAEASGAQTNDSASDDTGEGLSLEGAQNPNLTLEEETDRVVWVRCHPFGIGAHQNDIIINPVDRLNGYLVSEITPDKARKLIASQQGNLNTRLSKTPDKRL